MPGFSSYPARGAGALLLGDKLITETADDPAATETIELEALRDFLISQGVPVCIGKGGNISHTGNTSLHTFASVSLPVLQAGDQLAIEYQWSHPSSGNNKTERLYFGGTGGTIYHEIVATTTRTNRQNVCINIISTTSQKGGINTSSFTNSAIAAVTSATDVSAAGVALVLAGQLASSGETLTLDYYRVTLIRGVASL
jgi:hypothetical protein